MPPPFLVGRGEDRRAAASQAHAQSAPEVAPVDRAGAAVPRQQLSERARSSISARSQLVHGPAEPAVRRLPQQMPADVRGRGSSGSSASRSECGRLGSRRTRVRQSVSTARIPTSTSSPAGVDPGPRPTTSGRARAAQGAVHREPAATIRARTDAGALSATPARWRRLPSRAPSSGATAPCGSLGSSAAPHGNRRRSAPLPVPMPTNPARTSTRSPRRRPKASKRLAPRPNPERKVRPLPRRAASTGRPRISRFTARANTLWTAPTPAASDVERGPTDSAWSCHVASGDRRDEVLRVRHPAEDGALRLDHLEARRAGTRESTTPRNRTAPHTRSRGRSPRAPWCARTPRA